MSPTLLNEYVKAVPVLVARDLSSCSGRTIWDVLRSCLATIFACTWVAVHPNIPGPDETTLMIMLRRLKLMLMALLAPEFVVVWAMRQWFVAYRLKKKYRRYQWTMSHGFFALMGGFMLFDGDSPIRTLQPGELDILSQSGEIDFPSITEEEIQDRSKGDILSKGLAVLQTTWFILQCIARQVQDLPTTELEIVTLAFAALNFATYALWWHKPLDVKRAFRVPKKRSQCGGLGREGRGDEVNGGQEESESDDHHAFELGVALALAAKLPSKIAHGAITLILNTMWAICAIGFSTQHAITQAVDYIRSNGWSTIWRGLGVVIYPFLKMVTPRGNMKNGARSVPAFSAGDLNMSENFSIFFGGSLMTIIFGGIHCVAWSSHFPSHTEQVIWRVGSLSIICFPVLGWLAGTLLHLLDVEHKVGIPVPIPRAGASPLLTVVRGVVFIFGSGLFFGGGVLYVASRVMLLIIPLVSLRSLPPGAYETVNWTTYIPHI